MQRNTLQRQIALLCLSLLVSGCAVMRREPRPEDIVKPWNVETYAAFVERNIAATNTRYTRGYAAYAFVVDTESGSALIQDLIDPGVTGEAIEAMALPADDDGLRVAAIVDHLQREYTYVEEPEKWQTPAETMLRKRGDCKNLSLLLLSMLVQAGLDAHGAIANGHMWVNAIVDGHQIVLETDRSGERLPVYEIPGFYDDPLYKIYPRQTFKRVRLHPGPE